MANFVPTIVDGNHNDKFDSFHDLKDAGILLAILKTSQGISFIDPEYRPRKVRAASVGMLVGGYHWCDSSSPERQMDIFMSRLDEGDLMVLDWEYNVGHPEKDMTPCQLEKAIAYLVKKTGMLPLIYTGSMALDLDAKGKIDSDSIIRDCPMWISRYSDQRPKAIKTSSKSSGIVMWQYTGDGVGPMPHRVKGLNNDADLSVWTGGPIENLPKFVAKHAYKRLS